MEYSPLPLPAPLNSTVMKRNCRLKTLQNTTLSALFSQCSSPCWLLFWCRNRETCFTQCHEIPWCMWASRQYQNNGALRQGHTALFGVWVMAPSSTAPWQYMQCRLQHSGEDRIPPAPPSAVLLKPKCRALLWRGDDCDRGLCDGEDSCIGVMLMLWGSYVKGRLTWRVTYRFKGGLLM